MRIDLELILCTIVVIVCLYGHTKADKIADFIVKPWRIKARTEYLNTAMIDMDRIGREICEFGLWSDLQDDWFDALQESIERAYERLG